MEGARPLAAKRYRQQSPSSATTVSAARDWMCCLGLLAFLAVFYGLLQNGFWYPGNDSELYVSLARSIAAGDGYKFNGLPVAKVPPGWPLVLAAAIKLSPSFAFLNTLTLSFLLVTAGLWYWILRRFTTPRRVLLVMLIAGTLFPWYRLTFLLHSDALFCILFAGSLLLACQIAEGRSAPWRILLLAAMCGALVTVRWAGVIIWIVIAAALLRRQIRPTWSRQWVAVALTAAATVGAFIGTRAGLSALASRELASPQMQDMLAETADAALKIETTLAKPYAISPSGGVLPYLYRISDSGSWLTWLLWQPAELGASYRPLGHLVNAFGWVLILLVAVYVVDTVRQRQWLWLGVLLYCGALCSRWSHPNTRYLVPVLPLLLTGMYWGAEHVWRSLRSVGVRRAVRVAVGALIVSIVVCNFGIFATDLWVAWQDDFYASYRAGQCDNLIAAACYLDRHAAADDAIAVNSEYVNLNRLRKNSFGFRAASMLTHRKIRLVPQDVCRNRPDGALIAWANNREKAIRFYLCRVPVEPWRLGHFRVPRLQEWVTGQAAGPPSPYFELYELTADGPVSIVPADCGDWPRRVPGL